MHGRIRIVNGSKGYGFLRGADGVDRFFHANGQFPNEGDTPFAQLRENLDVEFDAVPAEQSPKGPRAERLKVR